MPKGGYYNRAGQQLGESTPIQKRQHARLLEIARKNHSAERIALSSLPGFVPVPTKLAVSGLKPKDLLEELRPSLNQQFFARLRKGPKKKG